MEVIECNTEVAMETIGEARLSPPQRFKRSLHQSAVRGVSQAQSRMDRSDGEPLPDVCRFLVHPSRFLVHRWISRLWLNLTA